MKNILLSSAAIVAFAGAASAEVAFSGEAEITTNSITGLEWSADLIVDLSQELNNGWTAAASATFTVADNVGVNYDNDVASSGLEVSLTSDAFGFYFGDTDTAAGINYSAPKALDGIEGDFDTEVFDSDGVQTVVRIEGSVGPVSAALSTAQNSSNTQAYFVQFSAAAEFGASTVSVAYQDADFDGYDDADADFIVGEAFAIALATTFGGADITLAYQDVTAGESSIGLGVSYVMGAATVGGYFTSNDGATGDVWGLDASYDVSDALTLGAEYESDESWEITAAYDANGITVDAAYDDASEWSLEASYAVSDDLSVFAGAEENGGSAVDYYVGASYDLGGSATLSASYGEDDDTSEGDEIGEQEYAEGTTVTLGFTF